MTPADDFHDARDAVESRLTFVVMVKTYKNYITDGHCRATRALESKNELCF